MPRILIADDNSNIQRMAALALKDAGIEVVAVGNGEAAVRKLSEVSPDLVLADIFMPVRNGYEVCEFVKHDPKYSNTPVLLLAGAFDPFDEHEAQRVQADGILKKPFVPPDPLINAVKTLLEKSANERLMAVTVPVEGQPAAKSAGTLATTAATAAEPPEEDAEAEAYSQPLSVVDFLASPKKDSAKEKASSFTSALSIETPETDEPEPVVTASRDPVLGEPTFWVPEEPEPQPESAAEESVEDLTDHTWSGSRPAPMREDPEPPLRVEIEPSAPKPAAAVHEVDLTGVAPVASVASTLPELAKEPIKEAVEEFPAPELPTFEAFSSPASGEGASQHTLESSPWGSDPAAHSLPDAPPLSAAPEISASAPISAFPESFAAPKISAPAAASSYSAPASTDDTSPLPETVIDSTEAAIAALRQFALQRQPETKLPEAEAQHTPEAWGIPELRQPVANAAAIELPAVSTTDDEDDSLLELEDTPPAFSDFAAPVTASTQALPHPEPVVEPALEPAAEIEQKAATHEVADDWPPVFVPVTSARATQTPKPALEIAAPPAILPSPTTPAELAPLSVPPDTAAELARDAASLASLSPEAQEAVIQRVIERMQPQLVELVTRQILRPLLESLVRSELGK